METYSLHFYFTWNSTENMNNNVRKLMLEAGYVAPEIAPRAQNLINLVIKECILVAQLEQSDDCVAEVDSVIKNIKDHFGM